jgi:hypothetical protein
MRPQTAGVRAFYGNAARTAPILTAVLSLILVMTLFRLVWHGWSRREIRADFPEGFLGIWYFVDYSQGFVRRGLVGTALTVVGLADNPNLVQIFSKLLALVALAILVILAYKLAEQAPLGIRPLVTFTIIVASPLYLLSIIRDPGRLDNVAILAGALIYGIYRVNVPRSWIQTALTAIVLVAATAAQELLFVYLLPFAVALQARSSSMSSGKTLPRIFIATIPATIVFILSLYQRTPDELVTYVAARTNATTSAADFGSPIWALQQNLQGAIQFTSGFDNHWLGVAVNGAAFLVSALALAYISGRWRTSLLLMAYLSAVTLTLSVVGVDSLRWWSLAFVAFVAASLASFDRVEVARADTTVITFIGTTFVGASVILALLGNLPITGGSLFSWAGLYFQVLRS